MNCGCQFPRSVRHAIGAVALVGVVAAVFPVAGEDRADRVVEQQRKLLSKNIAQARQVVVQPVPRPGPGGAGSTLILADREAIQALRLAEESLAKKPPKFDDAVRYLQAILDLAEDGFYHPDPEKTSLYLSLKAEAQQLLGRIPKAGRDAYELRHGVEAQQLLDSALQKGDRKALSTAARRFFHTKAGSEAAYRLAVEQFDLGRPLAAALGFERLRRHANGAGANREPLLSLRTALCWQQAGVSKKAIAVLAELRKSDDSRSVRIGGRDIGWFGADDDPLRWLAMNFGTLESGPALGVQEWAMHRGTASRNGLAAVSANAKAVRWQVATSIDPDPWRDPTEATESDAGRQLSSVVHNLQETYQRQNPALLPRLFPLVAGETVLLRTWGSLKAIDLTTGKRRWETMVDTTYWDILNGVDGRPVPNSKQLVSMVAGQRIWADANFGTLSSDGSRVYAIEDLGFGGTIYLPGKAPNQRRYLRPKTHNTLAAYDLATGRRQWAAGGAVGDPLGVLPQAGTFFLGAPLPFAGRLFVLADVSGEIRLTVLEPETGKVEWSQPLAVSSLNIQQDRFRRTAGTAVSYADGVMVCPTESGAVIAIDLNNRSLLWGHRFAALAPGRPVIRPPGGGPAGLIPAGWHDGTAIISDGKVLLTPRYSKELHCIDLLTGKPIWTKPRGDGMYVAGVAGQRVFVVGAGEVRSYQLADGKAAWKEPFALNGKSCGRGFLGGENLYLPQADGRILSIETATGRLSGAAKIAGGLVPGNLIGVGGVIISQGVNSVDAFPLPKFKAAAHFPPRPTNVVGR
jgi:outer membrane protein assembly factor BamB